MAKTEDHHSVAEHNPEKKPASLDFYLKDLHVALRATTEVHDGKSYPALEVTRYTGAERQTVVSRFFPTQTIKLMDWFKKFASWAANYKVKAVK